jgi:proteasome lid subunit RPN8/RPN11
MTVKTNASLAAGVRQEIEAHARETYPHECCGALIAVGGEITEAYRLPNTTDEGPRRRFRIGPSDYRLAESRALEIGGELAGFYHSHPDSPAKPSAYDLEHAWPNLLYTITSVANGTPRETTAWRLRDDRSDFDQVDL